MTLRISINIRIQIIYYCTSKINKNRKPTKNDLLDPNAK